MRRSGISRGERTKSTAPVLMAFCDISPNSAVSGDWTITKPALAMDVLNALRAVLAGPGKDNSNRLRPDLFGQRFEKHINRQVYMLASSDLGQVEFPVLDGHLCH